jgi:hypothetical protein
MIYGIYNIKKVNPKEDVVVCNNCENYYYEDVTDERNNNALEFIFDKNYFFKACPVCKTDGYLADVNLHEA